MGCVTLNVICTHVLWQHVNSSGLVLSPIAALKELPGSPRGAAASRVSRQPSREGENKQIKESRESRKLR